MRAQLTMLSVLLMLQSCSDGASQRDAQSPPSTTLSSGESSGEKSPAPRTSSAPMETSLSAASIPLVQGLTVVTAIHIDGLCDCESVKQITAVDRESVRVSYAADIPATGADLFGTAEESSEVHQVRGARVVGRQDLRDARYYMHLFGEGLPQRIPGSTALGVSAAVLTDLKTQGRAALSMPESGMGAALSGLLKQVAGPDLAGIKEIDDLANLDEVAGELERVGKSAVPLEVLVNGEMRALPAIHARGELGDLDGDFYILDDAANPLALKWTLGENRLQVVKIEFPLPPERQATEVQSKLACALGGRERRIEIHGVHFDFASAVIRPQSKPILEEIAATLRTQPDWSLRIEGHTDSIGSDAYNAQLSQARAEAIRQALINEHGVAASRLEGAGFGANRPKAPNDTLEGRARNRRVELVRTDKTGATSECASA